jgi:peptidyl-prolyl cis-trans isomerase A (cyclophilin A)
MPSSTKGAIPVAAACLFLFGCSSGNPPAKAPKKSAVPEHAPATFRVTFDTSKGPVVVEVTRDWAPHGADHFYELVRTGFYDGVRFFRVLPNFVIQFGISGDPSSTRLWSTLAIPDDPVKESNRKGTLTYAKRGPQSRTTQVFINMRDNKALDKDGFAPFGRVVSGMDVVSQFYSGYGEMAPRGQGPDPTQIELQGNTYLENHFPRLDYIKKATIQP